jgi:hypothetical protein
MRQALPAAVALLALLGGACGNSTSTATSITGPSDARCQVSVENSTPSFGPAGGTGTAAVTVARECSWSVATQSAWVSVTSGASGQGDATVSYRVGENVEPVVRQGSLSVSGRQISIAQQAAPCRYDLSADTGDPLPADGGDLVIEVRTHATCEWTAASEVSWASVAPGSGRGPTAVRVDVLSNPGAERRVEVRVAGQRLSVMQRARGAAPPAPAPTPSPGLPPPGPPAPSPAPPPPAPTPPAPTPPRPAPERKIDLTGEVGSLGGRCPRVSFRIQGRLVTTTEATKFKAVTCERLANGMDVKVKGTLVSGGTVIASEVKQDH